MQNLLSTSELTKDVVLDLIQSANKYYPIAKNKEFSDELSGKMLAALFYEPSTRTRLSTETAMLRLGGKVINAVGEEYSSLRKGETLYDTAKVMSNYADVIAIRHKIAGSAADFAKGASVPVINCGDGPADHPTQALLDAYTLYKQFGTLEGLTIAYAGDLKYSRTAHGLMNLLSKFGGKVRLASPESLKLPEEYRYDGLEYVECDTLEEVVQGANVIHASRVQQERFDDQNEYEKLKDYFVWNKAFVEQHAPEAIMISPLPRVDEIALDMDDWKGSKYFDAIVDGVAVRMALLTKLLCS